MITKEKFDSYVAVQESGETNMFNVGNVIELSGEELTREDCLDIMKNYAEYEEKFK